MLILVEALAVLVVAVAIAYASWAALSRTGAGTSTSTGTTRWEAAHSASAGTTRVVVRRVGRDGVVVDEHLIAELRDDAPDYDEQFLEAMSRARARAALYAAEE